MHHKMPNVPYTENAYLISAASNLRFVDLQAMNRNQLETWAHEFRRDVVHAWDQLGVPVTGGQPEDAIIADLKKLARLDTTSMLKLDEITGQADCIVRPGPVGATCNQFFPTMLKTKDIASTSLEGRSIYSHFVDEGLFERFVTHVEAMLKRDSMSLFSVPVKGGSDLKQTLRNAIEHGDTVWCAATDEERKGKTISSLEVADLMKSGLVAPDRCPEQARWYVLRKYPAQKRIMEAPKAFRLAFGGTPATNFPPSVAKFLYERFTANVPSERPAIVYDPSSGWGGRILGALACGHTRPIHYLGTDPNSDHWMADLDITKYEYLARYFHGNVPTRFKTTCHLFCLGSEVIRHDRDFQKYKGQIDFVFTSPPYFAAEGYSDEPTQSYKKFPTYTAWRDGFLTETLRTCVDWLREGGYLCLNIADIRLNGALYPLQQDAVDILLSLGLGRHADLKMILQQSPGGSKTTKSGTPTTRNFCRVNGRTRKYEPVLVFQKFVGHDE